MSHWIKGEQIAGIMQGNEIKHTRQTVYQGTAEEKLERSAPENEMVIGLGQKDTHQDIQPNMLVHVVSHEPLPGGHGRAIGLHKIIAPALHPVQETEHIRYCEPQPNHERVQQPLLPKS